MSINWCKAAFGAVLLFLTLLPTPSLGQRYDFTSYTTYDGLAQSQPYAILQSKTGYLWIGTDGGGVSRFDGHDFINFTKKDGLPSDGINAIIEDRNGHLWFATDEGVSRYDGKHFDTVAQDLIVHTLLADRQGKIWIGTLNNGLFRYDGTTTTHFAGEDGLPHQSVYALYEDARGTLWIGTGAGVCHRQDEAFACLSADDGLASDIVQALAADENGLLWIGTTEGLTLYDPAAETLTPAPQPEVQGVSIETILVAGNGMAWIGTDHGLVRIFRQRVMAYTKENGLPKDKVLALHEDREGNVWIGTSSYGLLRFTHGPFVLFDASHGLAQKTVWNIVEDQEQHLWFATNGGGVSRYDGRSFSTFTTADGLADNYVSAVVKDTEGALWFGTEDGISRYDGNRFTTIPGFKESVWSLALDHQDALWIGTSGSGLFKYENGRFTQYTAEDGLSDDTIIKIHEDRDGVLWLGTNNGVTRYDGETFSQITVADGLAHKMVFHILDDADGTLWFGTYGGGLTRYVPPHNGSAAQTQTYTVEDGLSNDYILSMVFDAEENLWICTNNGLNKVDPFEASSALHFTTYISTGGHLPRECNTGAAYQDSYGHLWFGMDEGLVRYTPADARANLQAPLTHIENVRLLFEEQDWSSWNTETKKGSALPASLEIPYHYNHLTFDFVGISLRAPKDVTYQ